MIFQLSIINGRIFSHKGLHSILRNIQGGKVGTVETPFTVYNNSSIIENKMHTEAVCLCTGITLWGPYVPTSIVIPVNSNLMGIFFRSP